MAGMGRTVLVLIIQCDCLQPGGDLLDTRGLLLPAVVSCQWPGALLT